MAQPTTPFGNTSVSALTAEVYQTIRRLSSTPVAGLNQTAIQGYIATWDAYFINFGKWVFRRTTKIIPCYTDTTIAAQANPGDTSILLTDNTGASASGGKIIVFGNEILYTGKDGANHITGVTNIDVIHYVGENVSFAVPLPTDCQRVGEVWMGATTPRNKLLHLDKRQKNRPPPGYFFAENGYLYLSTNIATSNLQLIYYKKAMKPGANDDLQTPEEWKNFVKWCAIAECYLTMGNTEKADEYFLKAGVPLQPGVEPVGILAMALARDQEQTDSQDEIFIPDLHDPSGMLLYSDNA